MNISTIPNNLIPEFINLFREPSKPYLQGKWIRQDFSNGDERLIVLWPQESNQNELLRVRIINTCKWDWETHRGYIVSIGDILDTYEIEYAISKAEIAFDTLSAKSAEDFFTSVSLKWGRTGKLFNYKSGKHRHGGSPTGVYEYMFNRMSPRQTYSYKKQYAQKSLSEGKLIETVYRWELRLRRKLLHRNGIDTIDDLLSGAESLIENSLVFKRLDRKKLNREIRRAKDWRLDGKSIAEQQRMMERNGLTKDQIRKFYETLSTPANLISTLSDPDRSELSESYGRYRYALWREFVLKTYGEHNKGVN